ncbi:MAG TPA: hypothetical protein VEJ46_11330 [Candidatus Acidoferrum sp.]|nr:hypothetical protein [Candidatus Acidoferrum sp.]
MAPYASPRRRLGGFKPPQGLVSRSSGDYLDHGGGVGVSAAVLGAVGLLV